ncbi:hypothetical protein [Streptomyces europaeiscabiei]|uniref:hypothetical protein n=1 Tax=Streptomyces europaeiscabiei TaxID=146819 RepID=UPI002E159D27|nr:hypothetical protein OHB30_33635 [Streptomyces europaeiscabiei]
MADPTGLRPEDRADFEAALHLALSTADIRNVLRADPTGLAARRLRVRALADTDRITATAQNEYGTYLSCRTLDTSAEQPDQCTPGRSAHAGLLSTLAALTPPVAVSSAAILLVLGYLLQGTVHGTLPESLITAGWILASVAALSAYLAVAALLCTAIRKRGNPVHPARLEQSRLDWQQALLERGMLPLLRRCIREDPTLQPVPAKAPLPNTPTTKPRSDPPLAG